jgi:hypothetical protein
MKHTVILLMVGAAIGALSQNILWDLQNLAWDYGLWFTFAPTVPAFIAIAMLRKEKTK